MHYATKELQQILRAKAHCLGAISTVKQVAFDSRKVFDGSQSLFFALQTNTNDGHFFLRDAYRKGVRNFVIHRKETLALFQPEEQKKIGYWLVKNTLTALQDFAQFHRNQYANPLLGITGSNGKTIVKEWLYQVLFEHFRVYKSPKSYNSQIGVALSLLQLEKTHEWAFIEAGISQKDEMFRLARMIQPKGGIFTNIGSAHQVNFADFTEKIKEKLLLFQAADFLIYSEDHQQIHQTVLRLRKKGFFQQKGFKVYTWSCHNKAADLYVKKMSRKEKHTILEVQDHQERVIDLQLPFVDRASIENALHIISFLSYCGLLNDKTIAALRQLESVEMRMELKAGFHDTTLINDAYNADLESLSVALNHLAGQHQHEDKSIILSDFQQAHHHPETLYAQIAAQINAIPLKRLIGVGKEIATFAAFFKARERFFYPDTAHLMAALPQIDFRNEAVLIKGARSFAFEQVVQKLVAKQHRTTLEINLTALVHNLNFYKSITKPQTKIMVMVKAFAYGSGAVEISNTLAAQKVDYLAVAYPDEGVFLREGGITTPIMVMNAEEVHFDLLQKYDLEPQIYGLHQLKNILVFLKSGDRLKIHLKLDTGMHRLGFEEADIVPLIQLLKQAPQLKICSIMSHLAASDEAKQDDFTYWQIRKFREMSQKIEDSLKIKCLKHLANTAGIIRFPEAHFDMLRLGLGLYGVDVTQNADIENVSTFKTVISQIKKVSCGDSIGYGRSERLKRDTLVATIAVGYGDGFSRYNSNGVGVVFVRGHYAPVLGKVCMDMSMIDVTDIPEIKEGEEVVIFGEALPIADVAKRLDTAPQEVLTSISNRVKRVYITEA